MDQEDFMQGLVRIRVDMPGLQADLRAARDLIKKEMKDAGSIRFDAAGTGPAGSTQRRRRSNTPPGSGGGGGGSGAGSGATEYNNAGLARSLRKQSIIEERSRVREFGREMTAELRKAARAYRKELKEILDNPLMTEAEKEIQLKVADKVFRRDVQDSIAFIKKQERQAAAEAKKAAEADRKEDLKNQKEADKAIVAARKEATKKSIEEKKRETAERKEADKALVAARKELEKRIAAEQKASQKERLEAEKAVAAARKEVQRREEAIRKQEIKDQKEADKAIVAARKERQKQIEQAEKEHQKRLDQIIKERRARNRPIRQAYRSGDMRLSSTSQMLRDDPNLTDAQRAEINRVRFEARQRNAEIRRDPHLRGEAKERLIKVNTQQAVKEMQRLHKEYLKTKAEMEKPIIPKVKQDKIIRDIKKTATRLRGSHGGATDAQVSAAALKAIRAVKALNQAAASLPEKVRIQLEVEADQAMREFDEVRRNVEKPIVGRIVDPRRERRDRFMGAMDRGFGGSIVGGRVKAMAASGPLGMALDGAVGGAAAMGAAYTAMSTKIAKDGIARLAMVEKYRMTLGIILKDQDKLNKLFGELEALDIKLPVGLDILAESAQKLAGAGFDTDKIAGYVEAISNAGAVSVDGLQEGVNRITRALTQIRSKSKLEMEDLNQIAELGIPIRQIIQEQFGKSSDELRDAIKEGSITMDQALEGIIQGFNANYAGALDAQGNSMMGMVDRVREAWSRFAGEASEPLFDSLKFALSEIIDMLADGRMENAMQPFIDGIHTAAGAVVVLVAEFEMLMEAIDATPLKPLLDILKLTGAGGVSLSELGKEATEAKEKEKELDKKLEATKDRIARQREEERRASLTPEERAAEDEKKKNLEEYRQHMSDFEQAKEGYKQRTGLEFKHGATSAEGIGLVDNFRDRQAFQPILDAQNEANDTSFTYDDFTEEERAKMKERGAKDDREKQKEQIIRRRAMAAGMTYEEFMEKQETLPGDPLGKAKEALPGLMGRSMSAARGALGGLFGAADRITGGALGAAGAALTPTAEKAFDVTKTNFERIRQEAIDNAATPEAKEALENLKIDLEGFKDKDGNLKVGFDMEAMKRQDFSTQSVGFGDLNRAIQDKIDQAKQMKAAEETAKATSELKKQFDKFLDAYLGGNRSPDLTSPIGP